MYNFKYYRYGVRDNGKLTSTTYICLFSGKFETIQDFWINTHIKCYMVLDYYTYKKISQNNSYISIPFLNGKIDLKKYPYRLHINFEEDNLVIDDKTSQTENEVNGALITSNKNNDMNKKNADRNYRRLSIHLEKLMNQIRKAKPHFRSNA